MDQFTERRLNPNGALFSTGTRAQHAPTQGLLNISLDYNAAPSGVARGTEVIIPNDASPDVRAAADAYNQAVVAFARSNGIEDYPNRGVKTREQNGRGVRNTMHVEPFFNSDSLMQQAIQSNPEAFAAIYRDSFGSLPNARVIAPHGVGADRGATSDIFGTETDFGRMMINTILNGGGMPAQGPAQGPAPSQGANAAFPSSETTPISGASTASGVDNGAFMAAINRAQGARPQHGQSQGATAPQGQPQDLTTQDRMAGVGAALMQLDQGGPQLQNLAQTLQQARQMPAFNRPKGLGL